MASALLRMGGYEQWRVIFSSVWEDFIGPDLRPLPGRELFWSFILDHRLRIAMEDGDLDRAEEIAGLIKDYEEKQARGLSRQTSRRYTEAERNCTNSQ